MEFNPAPPTVMHVDINSCFATIEQQANPRLRGVPTVVAAYAENHGCILAASREAKKLGIQTGMRVKEARSILKSLVVLPPDPNKYRYVNKQLQAILGSYTPNISVESIDEMVLSLADTPALEKYSKHSGLSNHESGIMNHDSDRTERQKITIQNSLFGIHGVEFAMQEIGKEIKRRIRNEIGEWITVSIGIAPNRYLSKVASGLHKPDGLDIISRRTVEETLSHMQLTDLCGIKEGNGNRLRCARITTPLAMYRAEADALEQAFHSVVGYYWCRRLHGYEDGSFYREFGTKEDEQKSFGQSHALGRPFAPEDPALWQILSQLTMKMARRLRSDGFTARGVGVGTLFDYTNYWHARQMYPGPLFADSDFYRRTRLLLLKAPSMPVKNLSVYCYNLKHDLYEQQSLLEEETKKERLTRALDLVSERWGDFVVTPARMLSMNERVLDRIAFGGGRGLTKTTK